MVWTVILTAIVSALIFSAVAMRNALKQKYSECATLRRRNEILTRKLEEQNEIETERRIDAAYRRGLYDGRETDTLYRSIISKLDRGEQTTVMMYGRGNNREQAERSANV